jgi:hypothetical protein
MKGSEMNTALNILSWLILIGAIVDVVRGLIAKHEDDLDECRLRQHKVDIALIQWLLVEILIALKGVITI